MTSNAGAVFLGSSWMPTLLKARQDRGDVGMEHHTASGNGRPARLGRRSGSHKGRQATLLCISTVLQRCVDQPKFEGVAPPVVSIVIHKQVAVVRLAKQFFRGRL